MILERERESNDPFREEMSRWSVTLNRVALMPQAGRAALTNPRLLSIVDEYSVLRAAVASGHPEQTEVPFRPSVRPSDDVVSLSIESRVESMAHFGPR